MQDQIKVEWMWTGQKDRSASLVYVVLVILFERVRQKIYLNLNYPNTNCEIISEVVDAINCVPDTLFMSDTP